jgi:hypothetical protein
MRASTLSVLALAWPLCACQWPTSPATALPAVIRVEGGQPQRGSIAAPASASPATASLFPKNATIFAGVTGKSIKGIVGPAANAAAIGVAGDVAYFLVPALAPDPSNPDSYTFSATLSVSPAVLASPLLEAEADGTSRLPLSVRAVDDSGNFGEATVQPLILDVPTLTGTLAVTLAWDTPTDLDLHVLVPAANDRGYVEVWSKARSADPATPDGTLDFDANAGCHIDGRERENVLWHGPPPVGHYVVRVAAPSLCGLPAAAFYAYASVPGVSKGEASGELTTAAERQGLMAGTGVTVFEFDYP